MKETRRALGKGLEQLFNSEQLDFNAFEKEIVTTTSENDIKNICFICQIDTDTCVIKGIDFDEHIRTKHRLWHYVYFLCYLYMKDEKEYNIMEYKVMSSINELNLSWIPFAGNNDD